MTETTKTPKPPKPSAPIHQKLKMVWCVWLVYRLLIYPTLIGMTTETGIAFGVFLGILWQVLVLLPAFVFTKAVWQGKSPYALIILSMITLVYLASAGVYLVLRLYEQAPMLISLGFGVETVLLLFINVYLFILLKRLPPMHKTWQNTNEGKGE